MSVKWSIANTRGSVYLFDPADLIIKPELNGRHEAPDVEELIDSIMIHGQLQPVLVRSENDKPVLIAGFSRWTAISEINKRKLTPERMKIAAVYIRCNEVEGYVRNWQENRARNSTTPMDDAHHFAQLERWGMGIGQIAEKLKLKPAFVKGRLKLIEAEPEIQAAVQSGKVTATAAGRIAKLSAEQQREVVKKNGKLNPADVAKATGTKVKPSLGRIKEFVEIRSAAAGTNAAVRDFCNELLTLMEGVDPSSNGDAH
jgi:ParB/RepB/Spo0J family partition protein